MKRDLELIRTLLLKMEAVDIELYPLSELLNDEYDMKQTSYHLELLQDANFVILKRGGIGCGSKNYLIVRMTSAGHDYLDSIRDESIWDQTKKQCSKIESVALNVIQAVASNIALSALGLKN